MTKGERWYPILTNPRQEATAAAHLWRANIPVFLPREWATRTHARRTQSVLRPHFPGYVFVRTSEERFSSIRSTVGVSDLVSVCGAPLAIPDRVMADFRQRYDADGLLVTRPAPAVDLPFDVGDAVLIKQGVWASFIGTVEAIDDKGHLRVLLTLFGRSTPVEMLAEWVESLSPKRAERARKRAGATP